MSPLDAKMAELKGRFVGRANDEIVSLDEALAAGNRQAVIERAHAIAGIAGMFGFADVGQAAIDLEDAGLGGGDLEEPARRLCELLAGLANS